MTLVATNVAARGLDINDVQLIIQVSFLLLDFCCCACFAYRVSLRMSLFFSGF